MITTTAFTGAWTVASEDMTVYKIVVRHGTDFSIRSRFTSTTKSRQRVLQKGFTTRGSVFLYQIGIPITCDKPGMYCYKDRPTGGLLCLLCKVPKGTEIVYGKDTNGWVTVNTLSLTPLMELPVGTVPTNLNNA